MDDDFTELAEMYRPQGPCERNCGHEATELWGLYKGPKRFAFLCHCCAIAGRLERAKEQAARIPDLLAQYEAAQASCGEKG